MQNILNKLHKFTSAQEPMKVEMSSIDDLKSQFKEVKAAGTSQFNPGWHEALALRNLLISSEAVAKSALLREESRGAHTREDFPSERMEWLEYNIINKIFIDKYPSIYKYNYNKL